MRSNVYLSGLRTAVFDIETTGLYPTSDKLILGGVLSAEDRSVVQHFAEDPSMEADVIQRTLDDLSAYDAIITYNGDSFDWPFLFSRARRYGLSTARTPFQSIDLYRWLKLYWPQAQRLPSLRQKSVEIALGLSDNREDVISGADSAQLYKNYTLNKDPCHKRDMLLHNRDDLTQLARIADALPFLPYHKIAMEQGFLIKGAVRNIRINRVSLNGLRLAASGVTDKGLLPASIYGANYIFEYDTSDGSVALTVQCEKRDGLIFAHTDGMPVSLEHFEDLGSLHRGYLVLKDAAQNLERTACLLVREMIASLMKEDLNG